MRKLTIALALLLSVVVFIPSSHAQIILTDAFREVRAQAYYGINFYGTLIESWGTASTHSTDATAGWAQDVSSSTTSLFGSRIYDWADQISTIGLDVVDDILSASASGSVQQDSWHNQNLTYSYLSLTFSIDGYYLYSLQTQRYDFYGNYLENVYDGFSVADGFSANTTGILAPGDYEFTIRFFDIDAKYHPPWEGIIPSHYDTPYYMNFALAPTEAPPVPEPSTMLLLGSGLAGLVGYGRRRMKK